MNLDLKKITGGMILFVGLILFFLSLANNNFNLALVALTSTLIFWVIYGLFFDAFDVRIFAFVISSAGFLLALSVFFLYGVEEVPHPIGAIVFHAGGIAGSLGIGLFSLFPLLILRQINSEKPPKSPGIKPDSEELDAEPELFSDDYEMANDDDLQSGDWETA